MKLRYEAGLAPIMIFVMIFLGIVARAGTVDDLQLKIQSREEEIKKIEEEIKEFERQIDKKATESGSLRNEITKLEAQIKRLNADIRLTEKKIDAAEIGIEKLNLEIDEKNESIRSRRIALAGILRSLNEADSISFVEIFLRNRNFSEFFNEIERFQSLQEAVVDDLGELKNLKGDLEKKESVKQEERFKLENLASELGDRKLIEDKVRKNKSKLLLETKNQESAFKKLLSKREQKRQEILDELQRIEDDLKLLIDPSSLPAKREGVLTWPLSNPLITQKFGNTDFAKARTDIYKNNFHNGIDFRAPMGTPVLAAEEGFVKSSGNSDLLCPGSAYGKWILIEHPNKLTSLYGHLSLVKASVNSKVLRGGIIAYSGDSGFTTGPHLHFTLYDARTVELRKTKYCGILPVGGLLDPLTYL